MAIKKPYREDRIILNQGIVRIILIRTPSGPAYGRPKSLQTILSNRGVRTKSLEKPLKKPYSEKYYRTIRKGITQRIHALRPAGCLQQFKIAPDDFVEPGALTKSHEKPLKKPCSMSKAFLMASPRGFEPLLPP